MACEGSARSRNVAEILPYSQPFATRFCAAENAAMTQGLTRKKLAAARGRLGWTGGTAASAIVGQREVGDAGRDLGAEARAVEHAIVPDIRLEIMRLVLGRNSRAQSVRGFGLADAGNVVMLAFDRQQRDARDHARIDHAAAMGHLALRQ